jgi:hypothetical protein
MGGGIGKGTGEMMTTERIVAMTSPIRPPEGHKGGQRGSEGGSQGGQRGSQRPADETRPHSLGQDLQTQVEVASGLATSRTAAHPFTWRCARLR